MDRRRVRWLAVVLAVAAIATFAAACGADDDADGADPTLPGQCAPGDPSCTLRQPVHWHADLAMYIDGEPFDFGDPRFLSTEEQELSATAHVHNPRHSVVHVHLEQTTWDEFFRSLGMRLTDSCLTLPGDEGEICADDSNGFTFIVNGIRVDTIRELDISDLQRTLIWYGPESPEEVLAEWHTLVSDESCIPSASCEDRMPEIPEEEPCSVLNETCN